MRTARFLIVEMAQARSPLIAVALNLHKRPRIAWRAAANATPATEYRHEGSDTPGDAGRDCHRFAWGCRARPQAGGIAGLRGAQQAAEDFELRVF